MTNSGADSARPSVKSGESILIDDLLENGQGVGRMGGLVAFITGALPGEQARIAVDAVKKRYVSAHAVGLDSISKDRVDPGCPVFPRCGGCQTLHLRYAAELEWKRRRVADALQRLGGMRDVDVESVAAASGAECGYRNKVALVHRRHGGKSRLGFYAARSHDLVAVEACPVLLPRLNAAVREIIAFAQETPDAMAGVEHVVVRASATCPEIVVCFNSARPNDALRARTAALLKRVPALTGVLANWDRHSENAIFGRRFAVVAGSPVVREQVDGATFAFGIASFFQIHTAILELLAAAVVEALGHSRRVVDLYCGVGTFAVLLGRRGIASTGVESYKPAVDEAAANASLNGVTNAAFECAAVLEAVSGERGRTLLEGADAVIVDPPRKGCEPEILNALARARVPLVAYVSCNPATLARDGSVLSASGYRARRIRPFDMFPRTGHVEVLAEFAKES